MDGFLNGLFAIVCLIIWTITIGPFTLATLLGVWDRKARTDWAALFLSTVALLLNLAVSAMLLSATHPDGVWALVAFLMPLTASASCLVAFVSCIRARFADYNAEKH
jgi:hypothetical protein